VKGAETVGRTLDGFELSNVELREGNRLCFVSPDAGSSQDERGNAYGN
jgi:hypothetical protein